MNIVDRLSDAERARADMIEVCRLIAEGEPVVDPELRRRIRDRADAARLEMLGRHGVTDLAVALIREGRDEE